MFERIAIMGAGSLGTILGAYIAQNRQIDLIDTNASHVEALNQNGARVEGGAALTVPVRALTPDQMEGTYDLFLYLAKQTYNEDCFAQMKAHSHRNTYYCTCQNGLPEMALVEAFGAEKVMGSPVGWGATFMGPGVSRLTSPIASCSSTLGTVSGEVTPELLAVKQIMECMCPITISTNLLGLRWCKVLMNATFSGMSTVMGDCFGAVMDAPLGLQAVAHIGRECVRAVAAAGIQMEPFHGAGIEVDFNKVFEFQNDQERAGTEAVCKEVWGPHRALLASMLQDLQHGRTCEIEYINGVVCQLGRKTGVPTPVNDMVVEVVRRIQDGALTLSPENLQHFTFMKDLE